MIFAGIHSTQPFSAYIFPLSSTLGLLPRFIDALFGVTGNFRLEFVMPYISQHTRDVPNLSCEYDCDLVTGFPFALVFRCTFTECVTRELCKRTKKLIDLF